MDYLSNNVAVNLKRIRKSKSMSLDQVSEQTGVSKSMLAQIERGTGQSFSGCAGEDYKWSEDRVSGADTAARVDCCLVTQIWLEMQRRLAITLQLSLRSFLM